MSAITPEIFDKLVDLLGADLAADVLRDVTGYLAEHTDCDPAVTVELVQADLISLSVHVQFSHEPGCPDAADRLRDRR